MIATNRLLTRRRPNVKLSRLLLSSVHRGFGGELLALITGGAFLEPSTMQFFYDLGIPVVNGYGLTEAGTALTLNDLNGRQRHVAIIPTITYDEMMSEATRMIDGGAQALWIAQNLARRRQRDGVVRP